VRGNVDTRLRRLEEGAFDALVMAEAALDRLGLAAGTPYVRLEEVVSSPGQGAIACQIRVDGPDISAINDPDAERCTSLERGILSALGGGCQSSFGARAVMEGPDCILDLFYEPPGSGPDGAIRKRLDAPRERADLLVGRAVDALL